ncbi:MAG: hypothetical protein IPM29_15750 [Planctomycetes bacterium]|nr:hypothetical protein [Planctomycetota bacterium]
MSDRSELGQSVRFLVCVALCAILPLRLVAQRTWIVDSANRPGTHFLDIDDAYAAAGVGDTILVRPGRNLPYDLPPEIRRSIRIVAPGAHPVPVRQRCLIREIPAGDIVVLDNLDFATEHFNASASLFRARGLVILSRLYASPMSTQHGAAHERATA